MVYMPVMMLKHAPQQILESCYHLVENLKKLKYLKIPKFPVATYDWRGSEVLNDEDATAIRFS
jgi:hypothetical protein